MQANIIAMTNQKGGVGKTTTAVNLATAMAACGLEVLLVDFDPQGNASTGLGIDEAQREANSYRILTGETSAAEAVLPTLVPRLSILPAVMDLSAGEVELSDLEGREFRLANALKANAKIFIISSLIAPFSGFVDGKWFMCGNRLYGAATMRVLCARGAGSIDENCFGSARKF